MLRERGDGQLSFLPLVDTVAEMLLEHLHEQFTDHFAGTQKYPWGKFSVIERVMSHLIERLGGVAEMPFEITFYQRRDIEPVPRRFIVTRHCQVEEAADERDTWFNNYSQEHSKMDGRFISTVTTFIMSFCVY